MAIYATQDYTLILAGTKQDLSLASPLKIRYTDPDGVEGELSAKAQGPNNGDACVDIPASLNTVVGGWKFQVEAGIAGRLYLSDKAYVTVNPPLGDPSP